MEKRYNHWFWNNSFMKYFARQVCKFDTWLWRKQYNRNRLFESDTYF